MKQKRITSSIEFILALCLLTTLFLPIHIKATEPSNTNEYINNDSLNNSLNYLYSKNDYDCIENNEIFVKLDTEIRHYLPNENIELTYSVLPYHLINEFNYNQENLSVISISKDSDDNSKINIAATPIDGSLESKLKIELFLDNGDKLISFLYIINNEFGSFFSPYSYDDAREYYFNFAINKGILTENECAKIRNDILKESCIEAIFTQRASLNNENANVMSTYLTPKSTSITVSGSLIWRDDSFRDHPLRGVMVQICDKDIYGSTIIDTVYTDNIGHFSCSFVSDGSSYEEYGVDIFIRVYPGDDNIVIKHSVASRYYWESDVTEDISSGDTISISNIFTMSSDCGRAFQISQALITARNYSKTMSGYTPSNVTVKYPQDDHCSYNYDNKTIKICQTITDDERPNSYASWDAIMHEYGHHIQYEMNMSDSPKGKHSSNENDIDVRVNEYLSEGQYEKLAEAKEEGIKLAWAESWPTVFALMAQQYYNTLLTNIDTVGDSSYISYRAWPYNVENTNTALGEACERSIMAVLWDIYDDDDEDGDNLALGHQAFWDVTTESQSKTFSDFVAHFYQKYPYYVENLGPILSYYQMATSKPVITNADSVSQTTPPTFSWSAQGGSEYFPNNSFVLIVYSITGTELYRTQTITSTSYTLTANQWNTILNSYGQTYSVAIAAVQTGNPTTGEYISERNLAIAKPPTQNLTLSMTLGNTAKFSERIVELKAGQCIDYRITFNVGGQKLLQTFGSKDTKMALYDSNGNLLASDDDSGYGLNSLISYYFNANVEYIVRVHFYSSSQVGKIKFTVTPARGALNSGASSIQKYEDIYSVKSYTGYTWSTYLEPNYTKAITFTPPSSGDYTFEITSNLDTYIYVIDPRSTEWIIIDVNYNDDAGEGNNAKLTTALEANVPYLVIYSTYNLTSLSQSTYITLNISKN